MFIYVWRISLCSYADLLRQTRVGPEPVDVCGADGGLRDAGEDPEVPPLQQRPQVPVRQAFPQRNQSQRQRI